MSIDRGQFLEKILARFVLDGVCGDEFTAQVSQKWGRSMTGVLRKHRIDSLNLTP
jgi:hypothetical protein